jgi:hypothetical protein
MKDENTAAHLTPDDLFRLAMPAAGDPEALPSHLLQCAECGRQFAAWKAAVRDLAEEDETALSRRSSEEWQALEDQTLAAIRREGVPGSQRRRLAWMLGVAASLLVAVMLVARRPVESPAPDLDDVAELSAEDRADDALLRDVADLARGEEAGGLWNSLAPVPGEAASEAEENL